jgi:hypothetical protein
LGTDKYGSKARVDKEPWSPLICSVEPYSVILQAFNRNFSFSKTTLLPARLHPAPELLREFILPHLAKEAVDARC